jgi:hypothetical protein
MGTTTSIDIEHLEGTRHMSKRLRCIAIHHSTGDRCRRFVGKRPSAAEYQLCAEHSKSGFLMFFAPSPAVRERLARGNWTNVRELR